MRTSTATLAATLLIATLPLSPATAQKKADPETAARLATLKLAMKDKKMARDGEAVQALNELGGTFDRLGKTDAKKVVRAVTAAITRGRLRTPDRGDVYIAATAALAKMGPAGAVQMQMVFEKKRFPNKKEWVFMRADLVRNIGKTEDPKMIKFLCDRVSRTAHDQVLLAAGETLANYAEADQKTRDPIVKALISKLGALEAAKSMQVLRADTPQSLAILNAGNTLEVIAAPYNATLAKLTHQRFENGNDWQRWYNKHKNKKWLPSKER